MVLLNRGSSFYEVINIPRKLFPVFRKKQIWISLHTTDKKVASIRSCSIIAKVNARFLREEQMLNLTGFENNSDDDIDEVLSKISSDVPLSPAEYDKGAIETFALNYCLDNISKDKKIITKSIDSLNYYNQLLKENIERFHAKDYQYIQIEVANYLQKNHLQMPSENCKKIFLHSFMLAFIQYLEIIIDYIKGAPIKEPVQLISSPPLLEQSVAPYTHPITYKKPNLSLADLSEVYNNEMSRNNVSQAQKDKINQRLYIMSLMLGHKKIRDISDEDLQTLTINLQWLPTRLDKTISPQDIPHIIKDCQKHPERCISEKTRADYIQSLKTIFNWAEKRKYIIENPINEIDIPAPIISKASNKYQTFTLSQLQTIFHSDFYSKHWDNNRQRRSFFWIGLLGLYTGARLNEICQLQFDDIQEEDGIKFISINENDGKHVKTKAGIRKIPIHQELIKLGFLEFVNLMQKQSPAKNKRIFMDLTPNSRGEFSAQPSKWFGKLLDSLGLKDKGLVFHSFRHTVRTILRNNNCPIDRVQRLCGWEGANSLSEHYGTISIKVLADELNEKLVYEGLDLSHLYI